MSGREGSRPSRKRKPAPLKGHDDSEFAPKKTSKRTLAKQQPTRSRKPRRSAEQNASETPYYCVPCKKSFPDESSLKKHSVEHTKGLTKTVHTCQACRKSFTEEAKFNEHILDHSKDVALLYNCQICSKTFYDILKDHTRKHSAAHH